MLLFALFTLILMVSHETEGKKAPSNSPLVQSLWPQFKSKFGKTYASSREERYRINIFAQNLATINSHNERAEQGLETFKMGINKFSDLTFDEFSSKYLGGRYHGSWPFASDPEVHLADSTETFPDFHDWRELGAIGAIKNQGSCGSCWSFSTVSSIESAYFLATGNKTSLSEQNLMDCSWLEGNLGCNGGWMSDAMKTVQRLGGIMTAQAYPYTGRDSIICKYSSNKAVVGIESYTAVYGVTNMKSAVKKTNVAVAMEVDDKFQHYKEGLFSSSACKNTENALNHAVNLVGWGSAPVPSGNSSRSDTNAEYWILRNSWSSSWGENGYARIQTGQCGIELTGVYPTVKLPFLLSED